jgi:hypothetical protein
MKEYGEVDIQIHVFLTSALVGGEWSASRPDRFTPEERAPGTHWIGGWVGPRTGLDDVEMRKFFILPGLELRHLGRPVRKDCALPTPNYNLVLLNCIFKSNLQVYFKFEGLHFSNN